MKLSMVEALEGILSWYQGCDVVPETLVNINRELAPLGLVAHFDFDIIVVRAKPRKAVAKPVRRKRSKTVQTVTVVEA